MKLFVLCLELISLFLLKMPRKLTLFLGGAIGILWFDVFRIRRRVVLENLQIAFPEKTDAQRKHIGRKSLVCLGQTLIEYLLMIRFKKNELKQFFEFQGLENFDAALAQQKGVLILSLHLGNGDFACMGASLLGYKIHLISKRLKPAFLNEAWFGLRQRFGTKFIREEKSTYEILRALRSKEMVCFVLDQFMGPPIGTRTLFFGKETGTAMGLAVFSQRTGAPIVPVYNFRDSNGKIHVVIEPPLRQGDLKGEPEDISRMTQLYTDKIEEIVCRYPDQWMWVHRRWKEFRDENGAQSGQKKR